jgi:O-antigen/teichoic acid export membrane protein
MRRVRILAEEATHPLYRNAYALLLSGVLTSGLGIIFWAIAARTYPLAEVGLNSTLISTLLFTGAISQLNLQSALYRYVPGAGDRASALVRGIYAFVGGASLIVGTVTAIALIALGVLPGGADAVNPWYGVAYVASVVIWSTFAIQDHVLASLRLTVWVPLENLVFAAVKLGLVVPFLAFHPFGIFVAWMVPAALGVIVVSGLILGVLLPRRRASGSQVHFTAREVVRFASADYVAGVFATSASTLMPIIVFVMLGAQESGWFYPVWLIGVTLRLVPTAMFASLMVESAAGHADFERDGRRVLRRLGLLIVPAVIAVVVAAPLPLLVFGADYAEAGALPLRILAVAVLPFTVNVFAAYFVRSRAQMRRMIAIDSALAVGSIGLSLVLVPLVGTTGVAIAVLVTQSVVAVVLSLTVLRPVFRAWRGVSVAEPA